MRVLRIGFLGFAALLVCLLISRVLTVDPARPHNNTILDEASGPQPTVPPPPELPSSKTSEPPKKPLRHTRVADTQVPPAPPLSHPTPVNHPASAAPVEAKVVIREVDEPPTSVENAPAAVSEIASVEEPKGPVIVVPHERPREDSRGVRWLKAMGHALGIHKEDSAEEAFR